MEAVAHDELHHVVLGHLSDDCNNPELAISRVHEALRNAKVVGVSVHCAGRERPRETIEVRRR